MKGITKERVDTTSVIRLIKFMRISGIVLIIISLIKTFFSVSGNNNIVIAQLMDSIFFMVLGIYLIHNAYSKKAKNKYGQFIEWDSDSIIFKLKDDLAVKNVNIKSIKKIDIHLNRIIIICVGDLEFDLNISDFKNFNDRYKIKSKFEEIIKTIPNKG